jgi:hypothetical protein
MASATPAGSLVTSRGHRHPALTIYLLLRMFGAVIADAYVRRGSPAGLLASRLILATQAPW